MTDLITIEKKENYAVLTIKREPVNSMNTAVWSALLAGLEEVENIPSMRGLVFRSGLDKHVFTAGNDILELYAPKSSESQYEKFWVTQTQFFSKLYRSRLVTIAQIRGACPAGGCALSLCCDYRIMTDFGNIGLNEVALGIPVPKFWSLLMVRTIGQRNAEYLLSQGLMPEAKEAYKLGLVDEIKNLDELEDTTHNIMKKFLALQDFGRISTKMHLRKNFSVDWEKFAKEEAKYGWQLISNPAVVSSIQAVLERLSSKTRA